MTDTAKAITRCSCGQPVEIMIDKDWLTPVNIYSEAMEEKRVTFQHPTYRSDKCFYCNRVHRHTEIKRRINERQEGYGDRMAAKNSRDGLRRGNIHSS